MEKLYRETLSNSTILLVDDNIELREHFKDVLSLYANNIIEASNGEEALEIFKKRDINIVISDIKMPIMDGLELTKEIREIDENIPVIIISAYAQQNVLLEFMKLHLVEYLIKPIKHNDFLTTLEKCAKILEDKSLIHFKISPNCFYDRSNKVIIRDNETLNLTTKESSLLELLIEYNGKLLPKDVIEYELYDTKPMGDTALKNLVFRLRKKLEPNTINTVSTHGYILNTI